MHTLRAASVHDLDFLTQIDRLDEGVSSIRRLLSAGEIHTHSESIRTFIQAEDKGAWIAEIGSSEQIGMILWRFRDRSTEVLPEWSVFHHIALEHFGADGRFCEIFQLWVDPRYRRHGIGSELKRAAEAEATKRGIRTMYTHTESKNTHVIDLNLKLGYREVRRGQIWDEIERVSMIRQIE